MIGLFCCRYSLHRAIRILGRAFDERDLFRRELGHIIMNHPGKPINISALRDMALADQPVLMGQIRSLDPRNKDTHDLDIEWEAEQFVYEVQKRIQRAHRMNELIKPLSSNVKLAEISEALFFDELR